MHYFVKKNITVGIDVGTRSTRVVVSGCTKNSHVPTILGVGTSLSKGLRHGYIINKKDVSKSIRAAVKAAEESSGVKIKSAFLSIGGISLEATVSNGSVIISRANGEVTDLDVEKVISISRENLRNTINKKIIYTIPLKFKVDGKDVLGRVHGIKGSKLEVKTFFILCLEQHINDLISATEESGVEVEDILAAPIAAGLVALTKKQRTVGCLLANIGAETVSISVFENDIPISLQVFPIGSTDITNDIALGLQVPLDEAERIKIGNNGGEKIIYPKRKLDEIIEARLSDVFELSEADLKKIKRNGLLPAGIILTGGGAGISTIEDFAKIALKLPSKIAGPNILKNHKDGIKDSSWFVAYGLCIYGFQQLKKSGSMEVIHTIKNNIVSWIKQFLP
jgi:cell division protein FtsA